MAIQQNMGMHRFYLEVAMEEAYLAYAKRTYPVGAVIVNPEGDIIGRGHNQVYSEGNFTAHAEVEAIREAGCLLMQTANFENCTLYTTLEPCLMCCGAILLARIKHVVWIMNDDDHGGLRLLHDNKHLIRNIHTQKLVSLEISAADACDLVGCMEAWMKNWNGGKEMVLKRWRQKDQSPNLI